jgi:hypothetical protein
MTPAPDSPSPADKDALSPVNLESVVFARGRSSPESMLADHRRKVHDEEKAAAIARLEDLPRYSNYVSRQPSANLPKVG